MSRPLVLLLLPLFFLGTFAQRASAQSGALWITDSNIATADASSDFHSKTDDWAVTLWVKPHASGTILAWNSAGVGNVPYIQITSQGKVLIQEQYGSVLETENIVAFDAWNHVAMTFYENTWSLYLNGVLESQSTVSELKFVARDGLTLGALNTQTVSNNDTLDHYSDHFSGLIDDVRFWEHNMTLKRLEKVMVSNTLGSHEPLAYWDFEEIANSQVSDASGNGNTLLLETELMATSFNRPYGAILDYTSDELLVWSESPSSTSDDLTVTLYDGSIDASIAVGNNGEAAEFEASSTTGLSAVYKEHWEIVVHGATVIELSALLNETPTGQEVFLVAEDADFSINPQLFAAQAGSSTNEVEALIDLTMTADTMFATVARIENSFSAFSASLGYGPFTENVRAGNKLTIYPSDSVVHVIMTLSASDSTYTTLTTDALDSMAITYNMGQLRENILWKMVNEYSTGYTVTQVVPITVTEVEPTISATSGWGPFVIGDSVANVFSVGDLDGDVSAVTFVFTNIYEVPQTLRNSNNEVVFDSLRIEGNPVDTATLEVQLADLRIPLSGKLGVFVEESSTGDVNKYYEALQMVSSAKWDTINNDFGPIATNAYTFSNDPNQSFDSVSSYALSFKLLNIPPLTDQVDWAFYDIDSTEIVSYTLLRNPNLSSTSVSSTEFDMTELPLSTRYIEAVLFSDGGPENGIVLRTDVEVVPQAPHVYASEGFGPFQQRNDRDTLDTGELQNTITVYPSSQNADSARFYWVKNDGSIYDSLTVDIVTEGDQQFAQFSYDMRALNYTIDSLGVTVFYPEGRDDGVSNGVSIEIMAPRPLLYSRLPLEEQLDGQIVVNDVLLNGLPSGTESATVTLKLDDEIVKTQTYTQEATPYRSYIEMTDEENFVVSSEATTAPSTFSAAIWFRTTSQEGGKLFGFESSKEGTSLEFDRHLYMDNDGHLHFGMNTTTGVVVVSTEYAFNDSEWHHVGVVFANSTMRMYIDGCQVSSTPVGEARSTYSGYWKIGDGNLAGWELAPDSFSFPGFLTEFAVWNDELDSREFVRAMSMGADSANATLALNYSFDNASVTSGVEDLAGSNDGEFVGDIEMHSNPEMDRVDFVFPDYLREGTHTLELVLDYDRAASENYVYTLREFDVASNWKFDAFDATISSSGGFGWITEGMAAATNIEFDLGDSFQQWAEDQQQEVDFDVLLAAIELQDTAADRTLSETTLELDPDEDGFEIFSGTLDMSDATTDSRLLVRFIPVCLDSNGNHTLCDTDIEYEEFYFSLWVRPIVPPTVTGRFGTYDQQLIEGTMESYETYQISTSAENVSFKLVAYSNEKWVAEGGSVEKVNDTLYYLTYDMATLPPSTTEVYINTYSSDGTVLEASDGPHFISVVQTRPDWFDYVTDFEDVLESDKEILFKAVANINPLSFAASGESDYRNIVTVQFTVPDYLPILADQIVSFFPADVVVPLRFNKEDNTLSFHDSPYTTTGVEVFGEGYNGKDETFVNSGDEYYRLTDSENFEAYQLTSSSLGTDGIPIKSTYNGLNRLYSVMDLVEDIEEGDIIGPTASISFDFGAARGHNFNIGMEDGIWGAKGDLEISQDGFSSASFEVASITAGLTTSIGLEACFGVAEADFALSMDGTVGFGYSYRQIPENSYKLLKSAAVHLYGKVTAKVFWGLWNKTLWGPETFYYNHWGADIPEWWPTAQDGWIWDELGTKPINDEILVTAESDSLAHQLVYADFFPHPEIVATDDGVAMAWLDQDRNTGVGSLKLNRWNAIDSSFLDPVEVAANRNGMNAIDMATGNGNTVITWSQNRMDPEDLTSNHKLSDMMKSQDIVVAVVDQDGESQLLMIDDDNSHLTSGRTDGMPRVCWIGEHEFLITWVVANTESRTSEIWWATLTSDGTSWNLSTPTALTSIGGVQRNLRLVSNGDGTAMLMWLSGIARTDTENKLVAMSYSQGNWSTPETIQESSESQIPGEFDVAWSTEGGVLAVLHREIDLEDDKVYQAYEVYTMDNASTSWQFATAGDIERFAHHPRVDVSPSGNIAVLFSSPSQSRAEGHMSDEWLLTSSWGNTANWYVHMNNPVLAAEDTKLTDVDIAWGTDNQLFVLNQELGKRGSGVISAKNGKRVGLSHMEQVLRVACVQDSVLIDVDEETFEKVVVGVDQDVFAIDHNVEFTLSPNPASSLVVIELMSQSAATRVDIVDLTGRTCISTSVNDIGRAHALPVDIAKLPNGQYFVRVEQGGAVSTQALSVVR